ncbi:MAG TPA: DUF6178 family protein [Myxococcales bacterium]|nr:DUF6178 family protein [Myxococcales bacterium]
MSTGNGSSALLDPRSAQRALQAAHGKEKLDLLLSAPDPEALVQSIPEHDLYLALLEIGPDDAAEVVALASPQQFRHFVDLAAWPRRDEGPNPRAVLRWLHFARDGGGHSDRARRRYLDKLGLLDAEMRSLLLRKALRVHDLQEEAEPAVADPGRTFRTPEGRYVVEFLPEAGEYGTLKELLEDLYGEDVLGTTRLLESLRWEVPTELEETARRWRDGRLRDLGFPDLEEAIAFYARPATGTPSDAPRAKPTASSALATRPPAAPELLESALSFLDGEERDRAEEGVVHALNAAMVANAVPFDEVDEVRDALADARATLSLGLETLSNGDARAAARALAERPIREIFQAGLAEPYRLQSRARRIAQSARLPQAQTVTLLDPPLSEMIEALQRKRPVWVDPAAPRRRRALGSRAEVAQAQQMLDEAEAVVALLRELGLAPAELGPRAEKAGIAPTALRASDAVRALAVQRLRGDADLKLRGDDPRGTPEGLAGAVGELLHGAARTLGTEAAGRAAARLTERAVKGTGN